MDKILQINNGYVKCKTPEIKKKLIQCCIEAARDDNVNDIFVNCEKDPNHYLNLGVKVFNNKLNE